MKKIFTKEFIIYCFVGCINTLVGTSTAFICLNFFFMSYALATTCSYLTGIIVSYFLNKKFTFKNKEKSVLQFVKFFTTMLPAYVVSYWLGFQISNICFKADGGIFYPLAVYAGNFFNIAQDKVQDNIAVLISIALFLIAGFSINKFIVFKNKKESAE